MNIKYEKEDKLLQLEITEELDHHEVEKIRRRVDYEIQRYMPRKVVFNFDKVPFMDSAGIGLIIGRYKLVKMYGGQVFLENIQPTIKKVLEMSGVLKIVSILEKANKN